VDTPRPQVRKLAPEDVQSLGVGTIVGWDADGLMTNVRWQDGSVEYCCTGFGGRFFLVLHIELCLPAPQPPPPPVLNSAICDCLSLNVSVSLELVTGWIDSSISEPTSSLLFPLPRPRRHP